LGKRFIESIEIDRYMKKYIEEINQVLSEWDPIGVGGEKARDEYRGYISNIIKSSGSKEGS
jgi:hypothetical protein